MGGGRLPTEAQWEYAARGGLDGRRRSPGATSRGRTAAIMANTWDGPDFPWRSTGESGWLRTSPVGSFPANGFGLFDMAGNVWEWTEDWWTSRHPDARRTRRAASRRTRAAASSRRASTPGQPQFPIPRKVIKGGSHLCADSYCLRYRPAARRPQMVDTGMSHVGFRCAWPPADRPGGVPVTDASCPRGDPAPPASASSRSSRPAVDVPAEDGSRYFDNDGTLWCERPTYVQLDFFLDALATSGAAPTPRSPSRQSSPRAQQATRPRSARSGWTAIALALAGLFEGRTPEEFARTGARVPRARPRTPG